ncbi:MAG TPA: succinate dehydrogenase cytochrome b subunit [Chlorobaculum parvum]|uniref:Succinate dehydrogenase cytochrome b subunit n=1 Tax=Chlorobaculum parvum TaxID=274539 RepID=A0A7C5DHP8_9CHLB|nr:succinate dehydrogenase cytochrome b subunit [Chlorobaculum parvum]
MGSSDNRALSSIASKVVMALAGAFLLVFLVVHLAINLLLLADDGGAAFSAAAEFMGVNPVIRVMELVLFAGFALHIAFGFVVSIRNRKSRPIRYVHKSRSETYPFSKYMMHTGMIVLLFLALHLIDFYFIKIGIIAPPPGIERHDFYHRAVLLFSDPLYSGIYFVSFLVLGFHLNHALQAAAQTLGLNHPRYTPLIKAASALYAIIIAGGFMAIPLRFTLFN